MNGSVAMESGKQEKGGAQFEASHYAADQGARRRKVSRTKGRGVVGHNDARSALEGNEILIAFHHLIP